MKKIMIVFVLFSWVLIVACGESPNNDLNARTPEQQQAADDLYKGLEKPVDRSKSKEY